MQMQDGAVWGGYPGVTAPLLPPAPSPPSQPTPEGTLVTPAPPETATPHNGLDELAPSRAGKFMHLLANFGTFNFFLNFFLHKTASSVPRGGIGNGHFIYSCSGTPAEQCHFFVHGHVEKPISGCCCAAAHRVFWYFGILIFPPLVRIFQSTRHQPHSSPVEMSCLPSTTPTVCSPERSQHLENTLLFSFSHLKTSTYWGDGFSECSSLCWLHAIFLNLHEMGD